MPPAWCYEAAGSIAGLSVNWLAQSTLLIATGLLIGRLVRRKGAAVESVVCRTTLAAVLVCPFITFAMAWAGVSGWSIAVPAVSSRVDSPSVATLPVPAHPVLTQGAAIPLPVGESPSATDWADSPPPPAFRSINPDASGFTPGEWATPAVSPSVPAEPAIEAKSASVDATEQPTWFGRFAVAVTGAWMLGAAVLTLRLALAWRALGRVRRSAAPAEPATQIACQRLADKIGVHAPEVLRSPYMPSPCLAGVRRPSILLPEAEDDADTVDLGDVLIHELGHLARHDTLWNLLRQGATALMFYQPLLWRLSHRIEATAEEVCDDYVVAFGSDRADYADRLLTIAELGSAPVAAVGVGIVSFRSMLGRRVARVLDTSRPLSTRVGVLLLTLAVGGGLAGSLVAGLVGLGTTVAEARVGEPSSDDAADEPDSDLVTISGRLLTPNGSPAVDARVLALRWHWNADNPAPLAETRTDNAGRFTIAYRKTQFFNDAARHDQWREAIIAGVANGYGPGWIDYGDLKSEDDAVIQLVPAGPPVRGRLIDLEGQPIEGAQVEVSHLAAMKQGNLDNYLTAIKSGQAISAAARHHESMLPSEAAEVWRVTTDADGRFQLTELGGERVAALKVSGPRVTTTYLRVATRKLEPIIHSAYSYQGADDQTQYGTAFEVAVEPSRAIEGVVRDAKTGEPIAGVRVWSWRFAGQSISGITTARCVSDSEGRYRLEGMPKGDGNEIMVVPQDSPYFTAEFVVPDPSGDLPVPLDLELHHGIWIEGRLTEEETGVPIAAQVFYLVAPDNAAAKGLPEFKHGIHVSAVQGRYTTDTAGRFRVVALPGRGVIAAKAVAGSYPGGQGFGSRRAGAN